MTGVSSTSPVEVEHAISQAQEVFEEGTWSRATVQHRSSIILNLARSLEARVDEMAILESLQTGIPDTTYITSYLIKYQYDRKSCS